MHVFLVMFGWYLVQSVNSAALKATSQSGIELITHFEGFRPDFYLDQVGMRTIGYGHACHGDGKNCGDINPPLSEEQGISLLFADLKSREACVAEALNVDVSPDAFSAMVSLAFNLGCEAFKSSNVLKNLNSNNTKAAGDAFREMNSINGITLSDLTARREAELNLFCSSNNC